MMIIIVFFEDLSFVLVLGGVLRGGRCVFIRLCFAGLAMGW